MRLRRPAEEPAPPGAGVCGRAGFPSSCLPCTGREREARQPTPVCCRAALRPLGVGHGTELGSQAAGAPRRRGPVASPAGAQRGAFCPAPLGSCVVMSHGRMFGVKRQTCQPHWEQVGCRGLSPSSHCVSLAVDCLRVLRVNGWRRSPLLMLSGPAGVDGPCGSR